MSQLIRSGLTGLSQLNFSRLDFSRLDIRQLDFNRAYVGMLSVAVVGLYGAVTVDAMISTPGTRSDAHNIVALPAADAAADTATDAGSENLTAVARLGVKRSDHIIITALPHVRPFGLKTAAKTLAARAKTITQPILVSSSADLHTKFTQVGFDLSEIRDGAAVPRLTLVSLPRDLPNLRSVQARKNLFIRVMLPLVLQANEQVRKDRARLLNLNVRRDNLGQADQVWLAALADKYGVEATDRRKLFSELKLRVDVVPPSLALAQAAEESGWGTSRFALEGNAVFGQWTYKKGQGIVPSERKEGARHEIKAFKGLRSSIAAYVHNLNTHWAYVEFRSGRSQARKGGDAPSGGHLIETLHKYSQRGADYIRTIKTIMRVNGFSVFDRARLRKIEGEET